jgi:glutathione synthase/RimK-type ligase-like ATP-grasp enzyme
MNVILRRRRLGATSTNAICNLLPDEFTVVRNDQLASVPMENCSTVFRWGCTSTIPVNHEIKVINSARAIHRVNNKRDFRMQLQEKYPVIVPKTWFDIGDENITYPCIVRPWTHSRGRYLYVCYNELDLLCALGEIDENFYISELINKKNEYRVFMVQGKVIAVAQKTPGNPEDIAWNVARGGRFDNVRWRDWPINVLEVARLAFEESKLHFGGVDVMVDQDDRPYVIEINSAPSLTSPYRQQCMAKAFKFMVDVTDDLLLPLDETRRGYGKFIHPCVERDMGG